MKIHWKYYNDAQKVSLIKKLKNEGFLLKEVVEIIGVSEPSIRRVCQIYHIEWEVGGRLGNTNALKHGQGRNTIMRKAQKVVAQDGRDLRICEECRLYNPFQNWAIHHKDRDRSNNTNENLVVLCDTCHGKKHERERNELGQYI